MYCHMLLVMLCFCVTGSGVLSCATCHAEFSSTWELLSHCQYDHHISIFLDKQQTGVSKNNINNDPVYKVNHMSVNKVNNVSVNKVNNVSVNNITFNNAVQC